MILLVDDDQEFLGELAGTLTDAGYIVLCAKDGRSAITLAEQHRLNISLAIIDLVLPELNGFELIGLLTRNTKAIKIVAASIARRAVLESALGVGADAVMQKPLLGTKLNAAEWLKAVAEQIGPASKRT